MPRLTRGARLARAWNTRPTFRIWCEDAWLKRGRKIVEFDTRAEAEAEAAKLTGATVRPGKGAAI